MVMILASCTAGAPAPGPTSGVATTPSARASPSPSSPVSSPDSTPSPPAAPVVWVAAETRGALVEVDASTRRVIRTVAVPGNPHNITVAADGTVVASLPAAGRVAVLRSGRLRAVGLGGSPHDVKVANGTIIVANEGLARLDLLSLGGRVKGHVDLVANPHDMAVDQDGETAWVSLDGSDRIAVVDLRTDKVFRYISTGHRPHDLLFAPGGQVWVTDWNTGVFVYSTVGTLLRELVPGAQIHHLAFDPTRPRAWLIDNVDQRVFVADTRSTRVLHSIAVQGAPHHASITPDGRWALVADNGAGTLLLFDAGTARQVGTVAVGAGPHGVWSVPTP